MKISEEDDDKVIWMIKCREKNTNNERINWDKIR